MVELIDVPDDVWQPAFRVPGWRVAVSRRVWDRCVALPEGVQGQTEAIRLWDLLVFLWTGIREAPVTDGELVAGFGFAASVVNDNRDEHPQANGHRWPDPNIRLAAFATIGRGGSPYLVVVSSEEVLAARFQGAAG